MMHFSEIPRPALSVPACNRELVLFFSVEGLATALQYGTTRLLRWRGLHHPLPACNSAAPWWRVLCDHGAFAREAGARYGTAQAALGLRATSWVRQSTPTSNTPCNPSYTLIHHSNHHSKCPCLPLGLPVIIPFFSVVPPTHRAMCLQNCSSAPAHHFNAAALPPVNAGVRKQCRLLGKSAHQAFVKVSQYAVAPPRVLPAPQPPAHAVARHRVAAQVRQSHAAIQVLAQQRQSENAGEIVLQSLASQHCKHLSG
jgi:hypothetical protein